LCNGFYATVLNTIETILVSTARQNDIV